MFIKKLTAILGLGLMGSTKHTLFFLDFPWRKIIITWNNILVYIYLFILLIQQKEGICYLTTHNILVYIYFFFLLTQQKEEGICYLTTHNILVYMYIFFYLHNRKKKESVI